SFASSKGPRATGAFSLPLFLAAIEVGDVEIERALRVIREFNSDDIVATAGLGRQPARPSAKSAIVPPDPIVFVRDSVLFVVGRHEDGGLERLSFRGQRGGWRRGRRPRWRGRRRG